MAITIGIDIRVLAGGRKSGIEEYTENLLAHMLPLDPAVRYKLFYSSAFRPLPDYPWLHLPNVEVKKFRIPNRLLFYSARFFNWPKIDRLIGGADIFFSPHFFLSPLSLACRRVTTFHDLSYVHFPEFFSWRKLLWHNLEMRPSWQARFSDAIIAVSDSTKQDMVKIYHIDPAKIYRVYSGIAPSIGRPAEDELVRFRREKNLPEKYVLYLGTLEPRKNITGLIDAFNELKDTDGTDDMHLVIAGPKGWLYDGIFRQAARSPHARQIMFADYIDDRDRPFYYSLASVFVYPSFFEGFGFPPLEAMACGTPVVASHTSSLPEVVGDAGILVAPQYSAGIAGGMKAVLKDARLRELLVKRGLERAKRFSWQKAAEQTLSVLTRA